MLCLRLAGAVLTALPHLKSVRASSALRQVPGDKNNMGAFAEPPDTSLCHLRQVTRLRCGTAHGRGGCVHARLQGGNGVAPLKSPRAGVAGARESVGEVQAAGFFQKAWQRSPSLPGP